MIVFGSPEATEYRLYIKLALSYLNMLDSDTVSRTMMEAAYGTDSGGLREWVSKKMNLVLEKARAIRDKGDTPQNRKVK